MYKPSTIQALSIVAIVLTSLGFLLSLFIALKFSGFYYFTLISWGILIWASIIGLQLSRYKLYDDEYKKVTIRVCWIIIAAIVALFVGYFIGIAISVVILAALWRLKSNYDDWEGPEELFKENTPPPAS